ncbi:MAG: ABC transporter ATP-binding protein [bacterium]|nr:ABC transporter ATP-binding protein [bacterium]
MNKILEINGLSKKYGRIQAVNNLNLTITSGQVYGILGPNGSGKTTTLGMILDVVAPTDGGYQWFGGEDPVKSRQKIGSILETPCFYNYMTAVQNLRVAAHIKECSFDRIDEVLKQVNLYERRNDPFKTYSLGMKQRLSIAAALLNDPPVMILDEPTNGLDPQGIAEVRDIIKNIARQGKTIIFASHLLDEVQKVCTHFCILRKGVKLHDGKVEDILGETNIVEISGDDNAQLLKSIETFKGTKSALHENGSVKVELEENFTSADINQYCFENDITLKKLLPQTKSLEQEFLKILDEN